MWLRTLPAYSLDVNTVLSNVLLPNGRKVDLTLSHGVISAVSDANGDDLSGWLLLPSLCEPHTHLDKALTADRVRNPSGDLPGAIAAWSTEVARLDRDEILVRARTALERLLLNGTTVIRTHINCSGPGGRRAVEALVELRDTMASLVDLQLAALPSVPLTGAAGASNRADLEWAIERGVDLVGGAPHVDARREDALELLITVAVEARLPLDLHTDETLDPSVLLLRRLAESVLGGRCTVPVTASHCVSLGSQPAPVQDEVAELVAAARIGIVTLPQSNLYLQGRKAQTAKPRGLTALHALMSAGVRVAAGGDNLQDPFNPMGRGDPLETASLLVTAGHLEPPDALECITGAARDVLGLPRVEIGPTADLLALPAVSVRAALADAPGTRRVYRRGRLVATSDWTGEVLGVPAV